MDFIVKRFCKYFIGMCIISNSIAKPRILSSCFYDTAQCPNSHVTFYLYTRATHDQPTKLDMFQSIDILNAKFVKDRPLIIIFHGYSGHHNYQPNDLLRPAFFDEDDFNIISVDYEPLARIPCYHFAVRNLPIVANCTAQLLDFLIDSNIVPLDTIHVIGFSLGAHAGGMVANYLKKDRILKRITGLDPAKPMFILANNDHRLDQNDAEFVDVLHTDVFSRGVLLPSGHVDFYANGGFDQPGCRDGGCNHLRAPAYYAESISTTSENRFWGFKCAHWYLYALGMCREEEANSLAEMGYNVNTSSRGLYFLTTNQESPYARGSNFTTNTIVPADNVESELVDQDREIANVD